MSMIFCKHCINKRKSNLANVRLGHGTLRGILHKRNKTVTPDQQRWPSSSAFVKWTWPAAVHTESSFTMKLFFCISSYLPPRGCALTNYLLVFRLCSVLDSSASRASFEAELYKVAKCLQRSVLIERFIIHLNKYYAHKLRFKADTTESSDGANGAISVENLHWCIV